MLRLLQGDVGSGKTAVAAYALAAAARAGYQGALLAPTDLLARQHRDTVGALLEGAGVDVVLLTGSLNAPRPGPRPRPDRLGPGVGGRRDPRAVQRIGVVRAARPGRDRRAASVRRRPARPARGQGRRPTTPHVLLMTATPIPRTLGQVLYADLDVSDLRTPPGRPPPDPDRHPPPRCARPGRGRKSARRRQPAGGRSWSCH